MLRFLAYRILSAIPVLFVMTIITFVIIHATPGDYADYVASMLRSQGHASNEVAQAAAVQFRIDHGLNDPLIVQYFRWIWDILHGDFGTSYFFNRPISEVIRQRLPPSLGLVLTVHVLGTIIGVTLGIIAATRQYSWVDNLFSFIGFLGISTPKFLFALVLIYILAFKIGVQELGSFYSSYWSYQPMSFGKFWNLILHVWPIILVGVMNGISYNMRMMRGNLLDTLNAQYVETARAKGLSNTMAVLKHAVPNALHPLAAYQSAVMRYLIEGEIETSVIFGIPTIGVAIVLSMSIGDVLVTATLMLMLGTLQILGSILSDLLLAWLDPRVRLGT
ncbi:MAG: ABC transporter permease [Pseudomonadota bacterium]|nr:ABC transporter permease [Pseudomonadota bacterium]